MPSTVSISDGVQVGVGRREVDLVEAGHDLEVVLQGQVAVGQGLGLDALGRVDQQDHAFAGREGPAHLVAEVDVARGVDQVEDVVLVGEANRLELDGDAPLALDVHGVQVLGAHVPRVHGTADFEDAVAERGLAVIDVGDHAERTDLGAVHRGLRERGGAVHATGGPTPRTNAERAGWERRPVCR
jgi:hypothetical protein